MHLTPGQKYTVRYLGAWEPFSTHSNGDVTVTVGDTVKQKVRISKDGMIISRTAAGGATTSSFQSSLSEELTKAVKTLAPKKEYKPLTSPTNFYSVTVCKANPECCKPKEVKAVFWDADHTIWNMPVTAASVTGKLKKIDDDTVVELGHGYKSYGYDYPIAKYSKWNIEDYLSKEEKELLFGLSADEKDFLLDEMAKEHNELNKGTEKPKVKKEEKESIQTTIKLFPTFRKTLDELEKRGITSSIISLNNPGSVKRILKEFGLDNRFVEIRDSYENKGKVFKELTHKQGICHCDAIFVDDNRTNIQDVTDKCGMSLQIGKGKDIEEPIQILEYIKG